MSTLCEALEAEKQSFIRSHETDCIELTQSLSHGSLGMAVFHIVRAKQTEELQQNATSWFRRLFNTQISAGRSSGLYQGLPAFHFVSRLAREAGIKNSEEAIIRLREPLENLLLCKSQIVRAKLSRGELLSFSDFDLLSGLAGMVTSADPEDSFSSDSFFHAVSTLVLICEEQSNGLPGWWVGHMPDLSVSNTSNHGNLGMAHGAAGILATLSRLVTKGYVVPGQLQAVACLTQFFIDLMQESKGCYWWPEVVTEVQYSTRTTKQEAPGRPSWCYGNPGISRSLQLAGQALERYDVQVAAERAILSSLNCESQLKLVVDYTLCHGWSGLLIALLRVAQEASSCGTRRELTVTMENLLTRETAVELQTDHGLLVGSAGTATVTCSLTDSALLEVPWDSCLLLS